MTASHDAVGGAAKRSALRLYKADFDSFSSRSAMDGRGRSKREPLVERVREWARGMGDRLAALDVWVEAFDVSVAKGLLSSGPMRATDVRNVRVMWLRHERERRRVEPIVAAELPTGPALDHGSLERRHLHLALEIGAHGVKVGIVLFSEARADVAAMRRRLASPERMLQFTGTLESLPEDVWLGIGPHGGLFSETLPPRELEARAATAVHLRSFLDRAERLSMPMCIFWHVPLAVAQVHAPLLGEQMADMLFALGGVYAHMAYALRGEDASAGRTRAAREHPKRAREERVREVPPPDPRKGSTKKKSAGAAETRSAHKATARLSAREEAGWRGTDGRPDDRESPLSSLERTLGDRALAHGIGPRPRLRSRLSVARTEDAVDTSRPVEKGARVEVTSGAFSGRVGVVQELDGRGTARIRLGLLSVWLPLAQVAAVVKERARPLLPSSHRRW